MVQLSTFRLILLAILLTATDRTGAADSPWPLRGEIDLSSGFGDFREARFHTGLDLRTGGVTGLPVYSPVDGSLWRIKMSYYGYGKGLYIKGKDGYLYVFGHLSGFVPAIDTVVKRAQVAAERYFVDLSIPADSMPVRKGSLIAYTGQTGAGAPHLHFEKRLTDEYPLNPLSHGFVLKDKIRPVLERVGFQMVDDHSLFDNGRRKQFFPVKSGKSAGQYRLDTVLYLSAPFGFLIDGFDRMRPEGMNQAIARLALSVDGRRVYETHFDTLAFATSKSVFFEYDYAEAVDGEKQVRRLFHRPWDDFAGSHSFDSSGGIFGSTRPPTGKHTATITAEDCFGNKSELTMTFMWGPPTPLAVLDSTKRLGVDTTRFYFSPTSAFDSLGIDSTEVILNLEDSWGVTPDATLRRLANNELFVQVVAGSTQSAVLALHHHSRIGGWIADEPFNGIIDRDPKLMEMSREIVEDGLIVALKMKSHFGTVARLDLYSRGKVVGRQIPPKYFNQFACYFFIPPKPEFAPIDSMAAVMTRDSAVPPFKVQRCYVRAVGFAPADTVTMDSLFTVIVHKSDLFAPLFLDLDKIMLPNRTMYKMSSDAYKLLPEDLFTRQDLEVRLFMNVINDKSYLNGLCRFDVKNNRWQWRSDSRFSADTLTATSGTGGIYCAVFDSDKPDISELSIQARQTIYENRPVIQFMVKDTLAGIEDDRSIDIRLDRTWLIPEYDPETFVCTARPPDSLAVGDHHLAIKVKDRAGNINEQYLIFTVARRSTPKTK